MGIENALRMMTRTGLLALIGWGLFVETARADEDVPRIAPLTQPMALSNSFGFKSDEDDEKDRAKDIEQLRKAASGIACAKEDLCLIAFDEGVEARLARLNSSEYRAEGGPAMLGSVGELDAEGVATDKKYFYVVGSHAAKRSCHEINDASKVLFRLKVAADGLSDKAEAGKLLPAIKSVEALDKAIDKQLKNGKGLDIEGVAVADGRLWVGFRGPTKDGEAHLLSVDAEAVFEDLDPKAKHFTTKVGKDRAIRDMQSVPGGLLLLVGPNDNPDNDDEPFGFVVWKESDGSSTTLAELDLTGLKRRKLEGCSEGRWWKAKPEAIHIVDTAAATWRVAVLSDGLCDGGPMWFDVRH